MSKRLQPLRIKKKEEKSLLEHFFHSLSLSFNNPQETEIKMEDERIKTWTKKINIF